MDIDFVLVGQRIREARRICGMTAEVLAEQIGLASESLRHIEIASSKPSLHTLFRIAAVLNVSMDYITGRTPTLADSLVSEYGLNEKQEMLLRDIIDSMIPIITNHI